MGYLGAVGLRIDLLRKAFRSRCPNNVARSGRVKAPWNTDYGSITAYPRLVHQVFAVERRLPRVARHGGARNVHHARRQPIGLLAHGPVRGGLPRRLFGELPSATLNRVQLRIQKAQRRDFPGAARSKPGCLLIQLGDLGAFEAQAAHQAPLTECKGVNSTLGGCGG